MKVFIRFFSACLLYLMLGGCFPNRDYHYAQINRQVCSLMNFKQGGFLLMQDSATGMIDSFYISFSDTGSSHPNEAREIYGELNTTITEYRGSDTVVIWNLQAVAFNWTRIWFYDSTYNYYELSPVISDPFDDGSNSTAPDANYKGEFLPQFNLNGHTYKDVFHYTYKSFTYPKEDQIYYNRDNGFIKIVLNNVSKHRSLTQTKANFERRY